MSSANNLICIEIRDLYSLVLPLFGFVCYGTQIKVKASPLNEDIYVGRKTDGHYMNIQFVCDADLRFLDAVVKWPGSVNDKTIWKLWIKRANGSFLVEST